MQRLVVVLALVGSTFVIGDGPKEKPARERLKPLNLLVGSWKGTGPPEGSLEEKQKGHWQDTVACEWQFKDADAWFVISFDKGKYFTRGELRYFAPKDRIQLKLMTIGKEALEYEGTLTG